MGILEARQAIASLYKDGDFPISAEGDVCLSSGCSHALSMAINVLSSKGTNLLVPRPGFSLYVTLCEYYGVEARCYDLDATRQWEIDLQQLESLIDENTSAILINNPSNPCGSNFSKQHCLDVLALAKRHCLPIISDEIYANMVFEGQTFYSMSALSKDVPLIVCGGLAKRYLIPGWRVGWLTIHDRNNVFKKGNVHTGIQKLSQTILGPCSLTQACVPFLLNQTPQTFYQSTMEKLQGNAKAFIDIVSKVDGLEAVTPVACMYVMVKIDMKRFPQYASDVEFAQALLDEKQVYVLPGACFRMPNFIRVVFCAPANVLKDAAQRIAEFVEEQQQQSEKK